MQLIIRFLLFILLNTVFVLLCHGQKDTSSYILEQNLKIKLLSESGDYLPNNQAIVDFRNRKLEIHRLSSLGFSRLYDFFSVPSQILSCYEIIKDSLTACISYPNCMIDHCPLIIAVQKETNSIYFLNSIDGSDFEKFYIHNELC